MTLPGRFSAVGPDYFQAAPTSHEGLPDPGQKRKQLDWLWRKFWRSGTLGLTDNEIKQETGPNQGVGARRYELRHRWCRCGHLHYLEQESDDHWEDTRALFTSEECKGDCTRHPFAGLVILDHDRSASVRQIPKPPHLAVLYPEDGRVRTRISPPYRKAGLVHVAYRFAGLLCTSSGNRCSICERRMVAP